MQTIHDLYCFIPKSGETVRSYPRLDPEHEWESEEERRQRADDKRKHFACLELERIGKLIRLHETSVCVVWRGRGG